MSRTVDAPRKLALENAYRRGEVVDSDRAHVLVACMPKSGSSLLIRMVAELPGMERVALVRGHDRRENELALERVVANQDSDWVAQAHVRQSRTTARMVRTFSLTPVVQTRDLADVCVSLHDHLLNIASVNPIAYVPEAFSAWPRERRLEFIVDTFMPWYLHFFLSWSEVRDVVRVGYSDLLSNPTEQLARVATAARIQAGEAELTAARDRALAADIPTRNAVVEGRGRELGPSARRALERLAGYYSGCDLSPLGL